MRRGVWLAYLVLALCVCGAWEQSGVPIMGSTQAPSGGGGTTVTLDSVYGTLDLNAANVAFTLHPGAPSGTGKGEMVFFWHSTAATITSVCNGTGTDGCTGSDTFISGGSYLNTGHFRSEIYYTCNTTTTTAPTITPSAATQIYGGLIVFDGQTTGAGLCNDGSGPKNAQSTSSTQLTAGAITTTNAHDLLVAAFSNNCGGTAYTAGVDGQGNAMTDTLAGSSGVVEIFYRQEAATNTYTPTAATGPTCSSGGNAQTMAFK